MNPFSQRAARALGSGALLVCGWVGSSAAVAQQSDIGYTALQNLLGAQTPTGAGVAAMHIEASLVAITDPTYPVYAPDTTNSAFAGKNFVFPGTPSTSPSGHATGVGLIYYGIGYMAYGITEVACYEADQWLGDIETAAAAAPINGSRIGNDSWAGDSGSAADNGVLLRLVDRQTQLYEWTQVVAMPYGAGSPLVAGAFNAVAVGETAASNFYGSDAVDSIYVAGRARPDVVAPLNSTSDATPFVASAVALLIETGHNGGTTLSNGSITIGGVGKIYDAERAMTLKTAVMAGADRSTNNSSTTANVTNYAGSGNQTSNGLDTRYGAGQIDILNSYEIIAAGEQHSLQSGGAPTIGLRGFDFQPAFGGGAGSSRVATYKFTASAGATLSASLGWYLGVSDDANLTTTLHHLVLTLLDATTQTVASSASTIDNTQNLWVNLNQGHEYELLVNSGEDDLFSWPYALAWNIVSGQLAPATPQVTATAISVTSGESTTLTVTPTGSGPFTYQWYQGTTGNTSAPIAGATGASFRTPALGVPTSYWVQVTGPGGTQNSATIAITITLGATSSGGAATDGPMPLWALLALGASLAGVASHRLKRVRAG